MNSFKVLSGLRPDKCGYSYGAGILEPSSMEEFDRLEGPRVITHINHPWNGEGQQEMEKSCIWLKTYGLKSFVINCPVGEVEEVVKALNLKKETEK